MTGADAGVLFADWAAPPGVRAAVTTRAGGVSAGSFATFNLAAHVGDAPLAVAENRARLAATLDLPSAPFWLHQVHGAIVAVHPGPGSSTPGMPPTADAAVADGPGAVLAVLTADCLPVVLARADGSAVGIAHAGWRGLAGGVVEATAAALAILPGAGAELVAWLGPSIEPAAFEVGAEVREAFLGRDEGAGACFVPNARGRWQADLAGLARRTLSRLGVSRIYGDSPGTYADADRWYSHRRDPGSGRMATLVWRERPARP